MTPTPQEDWDYAVRAARLLLKLNDYDGARELVLRLTFATDGVDSRLNDLSDLSKEVGV